MRLIKLTLVLLLPVIANAQQNTDAVEHFINLPAEVSAANMQTSSMSKWKDKVFLVPQYPNHFDDNIFCYDTLQMVAAISSGRLPRPQAYRITNLSNVISAIPDGNYEGIEATTTDNNNNIYFSIETENIYTPCYLVKGSIDSLERTITLNKPVPVRRPKPVDNAGFEALVYMPDRGQLIAFYEFNRDVEDAKAYFIDTATLRVNDSINFNAPLYFRLTEATYLGNGRFLGINYHWIGDSDRYIGRGHREAATREIGMNPYETSYSRIIEMNIDGNNLRFTHLKRISANNNNWEGLMPLGNGFFMVVDGIPVNYPCKISWFDN